MVPILPPLYLISPGTHGRGFDLVKGAEAAFEGGARMLQVREPHLTEAALSSLLEDLKSLSVVYGVHLLVNSGRGEGIRLARRLKIGVHLNPAWPLEGVRRELPGVLVAASVTSAEGAIKAGEHGADCVTLGPLPVHGDLPDLRRGPILPKIPVFGVGAVDPERAKRFMEAGFYGVGCLHFVFGQAASTDAPQASDVMITARVRDLVRAL